MPNGNTKTVKFIACSEGMTLNGFSVTRDQIQQMADNYDTSLYAARLNLDHIKSIFPDSVFRSFGLVKSVEAQEITEGALKGKLALHLTVDLDLEKDAELVRLNNSGQKIFSSIEYYESFPHVTGAYLSGVALTDSPASAGTQLITLSTQERGLPQGKNNLTASLETSCEFLEQVEKENKTDKSIGEKFVLSVKKALGLHKEHNSTEINVLREMVQLTAEKCGEALNQLSDVSALRTANDQQKQELSTLKEELSTLKKQLTQQDSSTEQRPASDGGSVQLAEY